MRLLALVSALALVSQSSAAGAWNARGHMAVAAVAWELMTPQARARATQLLRLNPNYAKWTENVASGERDLVAFVRAATWPDEIRSEGYEDDGYTPTSPTRSRNIGYADRLLHRYWHFKDLPLPPSGPAPFPVNAVTQIRTFSEAIGDASLSDDIRSYDLSWLLHLVGDIHQPLHATSRFNAATPTGDDGGNKIKVCSETARLCDSEHASKLHSFWDGSVGTSPSHRSAIAFAGRLPAAPAGQVAISDPDDWARESFEAARDVAYAPPIGAGRGPYRLTHTYRVRAGSVAQQRIALGGARLANILNARLN